MITNRLDFDLSVTFCIDGEQTSWMIRAGKFVPAKIPGILMSATSARPFKFQELELVGAFPNIPRIPCFVSSFAAAEDPDMEDAPVVPELGTIELRAYRCQFGRGAEYQHKDFKLNEGRVSERSKKAGWHHVR